MQFQRAMPVKKQHRYTLPLFAGYALLSVIVLLKVCYDVAHSDNAMTIEHIENPIRRNKSSVSPQDSINKILKRKNKDFNNKTKAQNTERASIIGEIDALNKRYRNALLKNADGEMADDDFQEVKKLTKGKIEVLERRLNDLAVVGTEIKDLVASTLKKVANIDRRYENGDIEEKRLIVSSMFPEFLEFDGTRHRTARLNSAVALICQNNSKLQSKKNETSLSFLDLSQEVIPLGL